MVAKALALGIDLPLNDMLIQACKEGYTGICQLLLAYPQVDPNVEDNRLFHIASTSGFTHILKLLLDDERTDAHVKRQRNTWQKLAEKHKREQAEECLAVTQFYPTEIVERMLVQFLQDGHEDRSSSLELQISLLWKNMQQ